MTIWAARPPYVESMRWNAGSSNAAAQSCLDDLAALQELADDGLVAEIDRSLADERRHAVGAAPRA